MRGLLIWFGWTNSFVFYVLGMIYYVARNTSYLPMPTATADQLSNIGFGFMGVAVVSFILGWAVGLYQERAAATAEATRLRQEIDSFIQQHRAVIEEYERRSSGGWY